LAEKLHNPGFFDRHLGTIVVAALVVIGWASTFTMMQSRLGVLEENYKDVVHRSEHAEVTRRIDTLEKELVPRSEHLIRDDQLNKRLDMIQDQIKSVQEDVAMIKTEVRRK
jgi:archaellum component FlaC